MIPSEELRQMLEKALSAHFGKPVRLTGLRRRPSPYASSAPLEELRVGLDGGQVVDLVFKDLRPGVRVDEARGIRPSLVDWPRREVEAYRRILPAAAGLVPACMGALWQPRIGRCGLLLEAVRGNHLWQHGNLKMWEEAARDLARLHLVLRMPGQAAARRARLLRYDREFYLAWRDRAASFLRGQRMSAVVRRKWSCLAGGYEAVAERLLGLPAALIHGECYPSNIMVRDGRRRGRICFIDWDMAAWAPAEMDLAALTSGEWGEKERTRMVRAYRSSLRRATGAAPSLGELADAVALCQLHQAVQWLGWSAAWKPPRLHQRDWLETALRLAGQLGFVQT